MPLISLATVDSNANASSMSGASVQIDELIVVVRMRPIELARDLDGVELRAVREPLAHRRRAAAGGTVLAQVDGGEVTGAAGRQPDDGVGEGDIGELHLDACHQEAASPER